MADKPEGTSENKPKFIVLCGPTGVGKSLVPANIFGLIREGIDFIKIEIDSLIVQNENFFK
jgi:ATP-dependent protease HslVU (ClpYQ) ATPase subunit